MQDLAHHFSTNNQEAGAQLSTTIHLYRYRVVERLLGAGIDLAKCDFLHSVLDPRFEMTSSDHLGAYISKVEAKECNTLQEEHKD
jgi:hypothetical protein